MFTIDFRLVQGYHEKYRALLRSVYMVRSILPRHGVENIAIALQLSKLRSDIAHNTPELNKIKSQVRNIFLEMIALQLSEERGNDPVLPELFINAYLEQDLLEYPKLCAQIPSAIALCISASKTNDLNQLAKVIGRIVAATMRFEEIWEPNVR